MKTTKKLLVTVFAFAMLFSFSFVSNAADVAPAQVGGVIQTGGNDSSVKIQWDQASGCGKGYYQIQKSVNGGATWDDVDDASATNASISGMSAGQSMMVRVAAFSGYSWSSGSVLGVWSVPITVYAAPAKVVSPVQVAATLNSATITWAPVAGANEYIVLSGDAVIATSATSTVVLGGLAPATDYESLKIITAMNLPNGVKVSSGYYTYCDTIKTLAPAYTTDQFGIGSVYSSLKKVSFEAAMGGSIDGYEIEGVSVKGKKKITVTGTSTWGTDNVYVATNHMYKYRARSFIVVNSVNVYSDWSPYRYFAVQKFSSKSSGKKIQAAWKKVTGAKDYVISVSSVSKDNGYKKYAVVGPKSGTITVKKCGKKSLKAGKYYYVRSVPRVKVGRKKINSDIFSYTDQYVSKY